MFYLFEKTGKTPDHPDILEMNPILYRWLYESWTKSVQEHWELERNVAILIGSFSNPKAAQQMQDGTTIEATDVDKTQELIDKLPSMQEKKKQRKHRLKL